MKRNHLDILSQDLSDFLTVAQNGSITAAARATGRDAGNLSRCLNRIESQRGTRLFVRHQGGLELTSEGQKLRDAIVVGQLAFQKQLNLTERRKMRVGFSAAIGFGYFGEFFSNPLIAGNFEPEFLVQSSMELFEKLKNRDIDLLIAPRVPKFPGIIAKKLGTDKMALVSNQGQTHDVVLASPRMFGLDKALQSIAYKSKWLIDDYFVIAKTVQENSRVMGIIPDTMLMHFPKLKVIKFFKDEGQITAMSWPGSIGVEVLKALKA